MTVAFIVAGAVSVVATLLAITRLNAVHALLYLIGSLLALAVTFYTLGAAFAAVLEVMVYAGAIVVLLLFVVMILNLGSHSRKSERSLLVPRIWIGPSILVVLIAAELAYLLLAKDRSGSALGGIGAASGNSVGSSTAYVSAQAVSMRVFGPYVIAVEAASFLLLAGVIGAFHLGRKWQETDGRNGTARAADQKKTVKEKEQVS